MPASVLIVEDDSLLRSLLAEMLMHAGYETHQAENAQQARTLLDEVGPDLVTIDIELGAGPNGIDLAAYLSQRDPELGIVFLTNLPDPRFIGSTPGSIPRHAAYIRKDSIAEPGVLQSVIEKVLRREIDSSMREHEDPARPLAQLSRSQIDVLRMISLGMANQQIADERGTSVRAVEHLIRRTFLAIGISTEESGNSRITAARAFIDAAGMPLSRG